MRRSLTLLGVTALAAASGCAALSAPSREERLREELDATVIERPLDEVWTAARHLLAERGLALAGKDREAEGQSDVSTLAYLSRAVETKETAGGGRRLETGWDGRRVRYAVEAIPAGAGWRVRCTAIHEHLTDHGHDGWAERAPEVELEILRRLDPQAAASLGPPGATRGGTVPGAAGPEERR